VPWAAGGCVSPTAILRDLDQRAAARRGGQNWIAPDGVPSGWVMFSTDPIMQQRFMDPQHQVILQLWIEPKLLVDDPRAFFRDLR
jgi:hypothetical protein